MRTARARPNVALISKPSMRPRPMRVPVPRRQGNQGNSRWIGRRRRGRSLRPPVRCRPALRHPPLIQGGLEDRPSSAISTGFLSREISISAKLTDREFRVARVLRGICYGDHHLHLASFCIWRTARAMSREIGIPSSLLDSFLKKTKRSAGRLMLVFSYVACTAQSVAIGSNAWQCIF